MVCEATKVLHPVAVQSINLTKDLYMKILFRHLFPRSSKHPNTALLQTNMLSQQSEYTDIIASSSSPPPSDESDRSSPDPDFSIRVDKIPAPAEDCGFRIDKEPSRPQSSYDEEARPQESTVQKVPAPSSTVSPDISPATSDSRPEVEEEEEIDLQKPLERLADHELSERINKHRTEIWDEYTGICVDWSTLVIPHC